MPTAMTLVPYFHTAHTCGMRVCITSSLHSCLQGFREKEFPPPTNQPKPTLQPTSLLYEGDFHWHSVPVSGMGPRVHSGLCTLHGTCFYFDSFRHGIAGSPDRACSDRAAWCVTCISKKIAPLLPFLSLPLLYTGAADLRA